MFALFRPQFLLLAALLLSGSAHTEPVEQNEEEHALKLADYCEGPAGDPATCKELHESIARKKQDYAERIASEKKPISCVRLKPGESAVVHYKNEGESPTGTVAKYRLTRASEDKYVAEIRLSFHRGESYPADVTDTALDVKFQKRVSSCLEEFFPSLKVAGKSLEIRLTKDEKVPEHRVQVQNNEIRGSVSQYKEEFDCSTILHEVLHVFGLPDEYKEHSNGFFYSAEFGYLFTNQGNRIPLNCRQHGNRDSIMAKPEGAAMVASKMEIWSIEQCECPENIDCVAKASESDGSVCPAGTTPQKGEQYLMPGDPVYPMKNARFFVLPKGKHEQKGTAAPQHSILYGAHFRAITEPGCMDVNRCYYACAVNAYRFQDPTGRVPVIPEYRAGCREIPADCRDKCFQ